MTTFLRYRKTVGMLLAVIAFVCQWMVVDRLQSRSQSAFADSSFGVAEVKERSLELLYLQTKDLRYLEEAMQSASMRFTALHLSPAFDEVTEEARFRLLVQAMQSRPSSWEDYLAERQALMHEMGSFWKDEWLQGAERLRRRATFAKVITFSISLLGLLLVWTAEAFPFRSGQDESSPT